VKRVTLHSELVIAFNELASHNLTDISFTELIDRVSRGAELVTGNPIYSGREARSSKLSGKRC
jgi:hypothetical protein